MGSSVLKTYNDSSHPSSYNLTWMQSIPDSTKISSMTIPGTHNSCALHGICCARTQSWSLPEQMKAGLDILTFVYVFIIIHYIHFMVS